MTRLADDGAVWQVVIDLAMCDPIAHDHATPSGMRCTLCAAEPPGRTSTITVGQHRLDCPYRAAVELVDAATGWNRPPE